MARKRSPADTDDPIDEPRLALPPRVHKNSTSQQDPREPLSTGVVDEDEHQPAIPRRRAEDLFSKYARNLVAHKGDVILALAATYDITPDEAEIRMVELHEQARGASRANTSISDMIERHDLSAEVRLARTREMVFGDDPRVALRAIEVLNDMDATAKSRRIGNTWETFVRKVRERAAIAALPKHGKA